MKKSYVCGVLCLLLLLSACKAPAVEAEPPKADITIVGEDASGSAEISVPANAAAQTPQDGAQDGEQTRDGAETEVFFEQAVVDGFPADFETLAAELTQSHDEDGNEVYADATRSVIGIEWDTEGARSHLMTTETAAFRYIVEYTPNGRKFRVTAVPMSTIDPNVCPDAYTTYTDLYYYGTEYYGYLYSTEANDVIMQTAYGPDHAPLFSMSITTNIYGESIENAFYNANGQLVCRAVGAEDAGEDTRTYEDASGASITIEAYDQLVLGVCGDWLNDYYGNVYGA